MSDDPSTNENSYKAAGSGPAKAGLAIMRLGLGAMFLYVFFENLYKGLYGKDGYADQINYYIEKGHAPGFWKSIMSLAANHATVAGPMQAVTEVSFGLFFILGLDQVRAMMERLPVRSVNLGTGENGMHPDFQPILTFLKSQPIKLTITSNGHSIAILSALEEPDMYCLILRGERPRLDIRMVAARDLPKISSACTTVVIARD